MDEASKHVIEFLTAMNTILWGPALYRDNGLWGKVVRRGLRPYLRPGSRLSIYGLKAPALAFGVYAEIGPNKWLEFEIEVRAHADSWEIDASVRVDDHENRYGGQRFLRDFPTRYADTMEECIVQLRAAVDDLAACDDVLDELPETRSQK